MKKIIYAGLFLLLIGVIVGYMMYNKPHQNILKAKTDFKMQASDLYGDFETDEKAANGKYLDKIIEISGIIQEVKTDGNGITSITLDAGGLMGGVICQLDEWSEHTDNNFQKGQNITFKGVCTGMLMDVVLVRCVKV